MKKSNRSGKRSIGTRFRYLFRDLRSQNAQKRYDAQRLLALIICVPIMLLCALYIGNWVLEKNRVEQDNASYQALYRPDASEAASIATSGSFTTAPANSPTPEPASPTRQPAAAASAKAVSLATQPAATPSATPSPSAAAIKTPAPLSPTAAAAEAAPSSPAQTACVTPIPVPQEEIIRATRSPKDGLPVLEIAVDATLVPRSTPNADTIVIAMETPPPVQHSFGDLLALNKDTVGYLSIGDVISLPVVQRANDNSYYLDHSFSCEESLAGTLFLDGSNLLVPEDDNLIIYGHNMRNGTMFHALSRYQELPFLQEHALVRFDTIYENRTYIPFAALSAGMDEGSERFLDVRQFVFDPSGFDSFIKKIEKLSIYDSPVNAIYGDNILMLVTCEYLHNNGRFIIVLREIRENETAEQMQELVKATRLK